MPEALPYPSFPPTTHTEERDTPCAVVVGEQHVLSVLYDGGDARVELGHDLVHGRCNPPTLAHTRRVRETRTHAHRERYVCTTEKYIELYRNRETHTPCAVVVGEQHVLSVLYDGGDARVELGHDLVHGRCDPGSLQREVRPRRPSSLCCRHSARKRTIRCERAK